MSCAPSGVLSQRGLGGKGGASAVAAESWPAICVCAVLNRFSTGARAIAARAFLLCADVLNDQADACGVKGNGVSLLVPFICCWTTNPSGVTSAAAVTSREIFQPQRVATTDEGSGSQQKHTSFVFHCKQIQCPSPELAPADSQSTGLGRNSVALLAHCRRELVAGNVHTLSSLLALCQSFPV